MSQIDTTGIAARAIPRRQTLPIPQMGITESLNAPGLIPIGPDDRSARVAAQFDAALAAAGSIVHTLAVDAERQRIEQDRVDAKAERLDAGHGSYAARLKAPARVQEVLDGKMQPPPGVSMDEWVQSVVDQDASGMSPAFREAYAKQIGPSLVDAWATRSNQVSEQARTTTNTYIFSGAASDTPTQQWIDEYKANNPQANDVQARAAVGFAKAEYAANTRDGAMLESAIKDAGLESIDKIKVESLRAKYRSEQTKFEQDQSDNAENTYVDRINNGEVPATVRDDLSKDTSLTPRAKLNLKRMLDGQIEKSTNEAQAANFNTFARDIELGRWMVNPGGTPSIDTTISDIERRAFLDPNDPNFISHGQMSFLLNSIKNQIHYDAGVEAVNAAFTDIANGRTSTFVATQRDDKAVVKVLGDRGILNVTPNGEKDPIVNTVSNPIDFARTVSEFGRVPEQVSDKIAAQMAAGDEQQALDGYAAYASLYLQNPVLAQSITKGDKSLQLKAAYIVSGLEKKGSNLVTDPDRLRGEIRSMLPQALKIDPKLVEYDRDQVLGVVYFKNAAASTSLGGQRQLLDSANTSAQNDIRDYMSTVVNAEGNFVRSWSRDANMENIPANVTETYLRNLDEQFRIYRSFMPDEESAVAAAKKSASERTMIDHPPQEWGGRVYFMPKGSPTVPKETITKELLAIPPEVVDTIAYSETANDRLDDLESNYVPEFDGEGWTFRSKANPNDYKLMFTDREWGKLRVTPATEKDENARLVRRVQDAQRNAVERRKTRWNDVYSKMGQGFTP